MATATNTILGEIKLAGDLAGNNNGLAPELTATGVTAGSYTLPALTIDSKGRITDASNITVSELNGILPTASTTQKGIVRIGSGINVTNGLISIPTASSSIRGAVKVDCGVLKVSDETLIYDDGAVPLASTTTHGVVKISEGNGLSVSAGVLSATTIPIASTTVKGIFEVGSGLSINGSGVLSLPPASDTVLGGIKVNTDHFSVDGTGMMSISNTLIASSTQFGLVKLGGNITSVGGVVNVVIDKASDTALGAIKVGSGLAIDGGGVLSAPGAISPTVATTSNLGVVQIGAGINVSGGIISMPDASTTVKGSIKIGSLGINVSGGVISAKLSTPTNYGVVKTTDMNDISIVDGIISTGSNIPKSTTVNVFVKAQVTQLVDLGDVSGTVTLDLSSGNVFKMRLIGNTSLANPINAISGGIYHIVVSQDTVGARTLSLGTSFKFVDANIEYRASGTSVLTLVCVSASSIITSVVRGFLGV